MPLMQLPLHSCVIDVGDAGRVLWSPASTFDEATLRALGTVTDIVAPNLFHTDGAVAAARVHPQARLWGPVGIEAHAPSVRWLVLGRDAWIHEDALQHLTIDGMPTINENVFVHRASGTLFVADLVFNIVDPQGVGARVILSLFGTWKRFGVSRLYLKRVTDRAAFEASLKRLHAGAFDAIVVAHGERVDSGAKDRLFAALHERGYAQSLS